MPAKAVITTPFPTVQETAREMGVAAKRVRLLRKLMTTIVKGQDGRVVRFLTHGGMAASRAKRRAAAKGSVTKRKRASHR
ncbi:MAG: hypothetical protein AUH69_08455 [Actinobacteria bacterium 13_1_40CM_4_65_12]|nr:MAG: hypothetical protein AUH69_08455 [Actinobacteria bacterium 13_1_40CM_4_65_12]